MIALKTTPIPFSKRFTNRLAGTMLVLLLMAVVLVGSIVYLRATQSLTTSMYERLAAIAGLKRENLNRWIDQQRASIVFIAFQPDVRRQVGTLIDPASSGASATQADRQAAYTALSEYLNFVVTSVANVNELSIVDMDGAVVLSTLPDHEGQLHAEDEFFRQGIFTTYTQPVTISQADGLPRITVSTPLFNQNGRRVGVLVGQLNLARVDHIFRDRGGLVTSDETYLVTASHLFVSAASYPGASQERRSAGIEAALNGQEGKAVYANYLGVPVLGVYLWLDDLKVALLAEMSQAEAYAPARRLALTTFVFGGLAALVLAGAAYLMARRITRPVMAITETANRVADGDLSHIAPVLSDDEVGRLAVTFNEMTGQLRLLYEGLENQVADRTAQLSRANHLLETEIVERRQAQDQLRIQNAYLAALHETTIGVISRLDVNELLETLVTRAGQLMNTSDGFIYLANPGEHEIECKVGVGAFSRLVGFRVAAGEGLGGTVWETGRPLVVNDYDHWEGRARSIEANLIRSIIGVPLMAGERSVGVLGLAYGTGAAANLMFGGDEIELLDRFAHLASIALENARLYQVVTEALQQEEVQNERMQRELLMARQVQESLLPTDLPRIAGWSFARLWRPARQVSGDFYDLILEGPDQLGLVVGDVTDKGLPASLFMVFTSSALRASLAQASDPAQAIRMANQIVCRDSFEGLFASLVYARLATGYGALTYVNAGHNPPLLYRAEDDTLQPFRRTGMPLGVMDDSTYEENTLQLLPGDFILFYTDGVTEAAGPGSEEFGQERLMQAMRSLKDRPAAELVRGLEQALDTFIDHTQPVDDITLFIVRRDESSALAGVP